MGATPKIPSKSRQIFKTFYMNGENKVLKLFYIIAFLAFAGVSCWATAESLHMLLPTWPIVFCYVVTIGFFIIASLGTKMIVDSLNQNIYLEKRGLRLIGGVVIVLVFWLVCSMPTNTHTFFYRSVANGIAKEDIGTTKGYLNQLVNDTQIETQIKAKQTELDNKVKAKLTDLETEIKNDANPGFGPHAKEILRQFAELLDVPTVDPISYQSTSVQQRERLVDMYRKKIFALADTKKQAIRNSMEAANKIEYQRAAKTAATNLDLIAEEMNNNPSALNDVAFAHELDNRLLTGYATIKTYNNFVSFDNETDKERYTAEHPVTKIKRLMSVFDVWKDTFKGLYKGHGFIFWILISILVDIAAFIFFDLAFKKED